MFPSVDWSTLLRHLTDTPPNRESKPNEKCGIITLCTHPIMHHSYSRLHLPHQHLLPAYLGVLYDCSGAWNQHILMVLGLLRGVDANSLIFR